MNPIEEWERDQVPQHKKSRKNIKRPFSIEYKLNPSTWVTCSFRWMFKGGNIWKIYRKYETEKSRDEALETLTKKENNRQTGLFMYRKGEENEK